VRVWRSFLKGARSGATLLIAVAAIGILVGSLDSTGLGLKLANLISTVRGDSLFSALLIAMIGALVLGMGMPTLPAYLIIILVMGPAIQALGVSILTAHMFVFYYGVASSLTPPVAIAAYAAAPIANANPLFTALMAFRLGMAKFIIPFVFAFYPTVLIIETFSLLPFIWIVLRTAPTFCSSSPINTAPITSAATAILSFRHRTSTVLPSTAHAGTGSTSPTPSACPIARRS